MLEIFVLSIAAFFVDVLLGSLRGQKVAVKVLKDSSKAAQKFLAEASVMTYVP